MFSSLVENRYLIDKNASEDQCEGLVSVDFGQFIFRTLSLFSLSHTLGNLKFLGALLK